MNIITSQLFILASEASQNSQATATTPQSGSIWSFVLMTVAFVAVFYLLLIRPQKKKEKESKNMRDSIKIGDEITTIGGIVGIVVKKTQDTIVLETGGDRSKIRVKLWAVQENATVHDIEESVAEAKKAKKEKKSKQDSDADIETGEEVD